MPYSPLSLETLHRALSCDPAAMLQVIQLYNAYINRLAKRPALGSDGMIYLYTDEDMKQELILELLTKIPRFRIPEVQDAKP